MDSIHPGDKGCSGIARRGTPIEVPFIWRSETEFSAVVFASFFPILGVGFAAHVLPGAMVHGLMVCIGFGDLPID
jgi:hypothetical protein